MIQTIFTKNNKIQITDTTVIRVGNTGGYLLQKWNILCRVKKRGGKISNFIKSTKTNSPTSQSGATNLFPIGDSFMYIEKSSNNHGDDVIVSFERSDIIQITTITFY